MQVEQNIPNYYTVQQLVDKHPFITIGGLRYDIHRSREAKSSKGVVEANGLAEAIIRKGRRVLIDEEKYFAWLRDQNKAPR